MPPKVVCIVGPTGCGKTGLGVALAERLGGEVVSCDSMQLYRGMVIGTAAPTEAETRGVPHHMVGVIDPRGSGKKNCPPLQKCCPRKRAPSSPDYY